MTLKVLCVLLTQVKVDIQLVQLCSEDKYQLMMLIKASSKCKKIIKLSLKSGSQIIFNQVSVVFLLKELKCQVHLLATQLQSKIYLNVFLNSLQLCLGRSLTCTGIQMKEWMKWNLLKLNLTWMTSYQSTKHVTLLTQKIIMIWKTTKMNGEL